MVSNNFYIPGVTPANTLVLSPSFDRFAASAKNFALQDKYGGTQCCVSMAQLPATSSLQFDKADYGALINLANKARKV